MIDDKYLELLDMYISLTEKQDEAIAQLSSIVAKQATELAHLRNAAIMDSNESSALSIAKEAIEKFEGTHEP